MRKTSNPGRYGSLYRLAERTLAFPPGQLAHQVKVVVLPARQHTTFRRIVEGWNDDFLWLTLPQLRQGGLYRQLLRWETEGFPPAEGVFVSATHLLLPEDAEDLCPAIEYYFRFALPPSLFCILSDKPGLGQALEARGPHFTVHSPVFETINGQA